MKPIYKLTIPELETIARMLELMDDVKEICPEHESIILESSQDDEDRENIARAKSLGFTHVVLPFVGLGGDDFLFFGSYKDCLEFAIKQCICR